MKFKIDRVIEDLNKACGDDCMSIVAAEGPTARVSGWCSTGSLTLDLAVSQTYPGGLPYGRLVEISGETQHGKSSLLYSILAENQHDGGLSVLFDLENGFEYKYARALGLDIDKLVYNEGTVLETVLQQMGTTISYMTEHHPDRPVVIGWDSIPATISKEQSENDYEDGRIAIHARALSRVIPKLIMDLKTARAVVVATNQIRYFQRAYTPGGRAVPFYSQVRIKVKRVSDMISPDSEHVRGIRCEAKVFKNKVAAPFHMGYFNLDYVHGLYDYDSWLPVLADRGVIVRKGTWYKLPMPDGETKSFQIGSYLRAIRDDQELKDHTQQLLVASYEESGD